MAGLIAVCICMVLAFWAFESLHCVFFLVLAEYPSWSLGSSRFILSIQSHHSETVSVHRMKLCGISWCMLLFTRRVCGTPKMRKKEKLTNISYYITVVPAESGIPKLPHQVFHDLLARNSIMNPVWSLTNSCDSLSCESNWGLIAIFR